MSVYDNPDNIPTCVGTTDIATCKLCGARHETVKLFLLRGETYFICPRRADRVPFGVAPAPVAVETPTSRLLQIGSTRLTTGVFKPTASLIERLQAGEEQVAVQVGDETMAEGEVGMLMALCGPADDPQSCREACLYSAAPELFDVAHNLVKLLADPLNMGALALMPQLHQPLLSIFQAAQKASCKAITGRTTPESQAVAALI